MSELIRFNIKNVKYAVAINTDGVRSYQSPEAMGFASAISLEANYSEKPLYGDGEIQAVLASDKGKTGSLTLLTVDNKYEIAMKRKMEIAGGLADIQQKSTIEHAIYFEFDYLDKDDNAIKTAKSIIYGVFSGRPSESLNQTEDEINNNNIEMSLTIKGTTLRNAEGNEDYKDANGNTLKVWQQTCIPSDKDYATFGTTITEPKAKGV